MEYNDQTAKKIVSKDLCENGANSPTRHVEYECPCGKGKIIYEHVVGFCDFYAWIECDECEEKFEVALGRGHFWELVEKF